MKILFLIATLFFIGCSSQPDNLVYSDNFDGEFKKEAWEIRQNTKWEVKDGYLIGTPSPAEYQEMMRKKKDSHTGQWPIIRLLNIPAQFTCTMRLKYEGKKFEKNRPLLDVGHHINSFLFRADNTRLMLKNKKAIMRQGQFLPLNKWVDVKIILIEGKLTISIDGKTEVYENSEITMDGHSEFTFKGLTNGRILFDHVTLSEIK
ncbi:MAG: hypothetical protein NE328_19225 [Lentisphaeraceae bacterium]|nr:hypothetical protein [Lentisphaeraceae bacterium]